MNLGEEVNGYTANATQGINVNARSNISDNEIQLTEKAMFRREDEINQNSRSNRFKFILASVGTILFGAGGGSIIAAVARADKISVAAKVIGYGGGIAICAVGAIVAFMIIWNLTHPKDEAWKQYEQKTHHLLERTGRVIDKEANEAEKASTAASLTRSATSTATFDTVSRIFMNNLAANENISYAKNINSKGQVLDAVITHKNKARGITEDDMRKAIKAYNYIDPGQLQYSLNTLTNILNNRLGHH